MSAEVAYAPPEKAEAPRNFAGLLIGIILCVVGALVIYTGIDHVRGVADVAPSMGLLAAGALLLFAGASRVWPGRALVNAGIFGAGLACVVVSGGLLADHLRDAAYAVLLTLVGMVLIVIGVQVAKERWKKLTMR
jgi:peptidoglycan/LPS O-acetylase OafA/YrhL